jgi:branched-chain amino acid transport system permease protein
MDRAIAFLLALLFVSIIWLFISKNKFGKAMGAVSQDEVAAKLMGINTELIYALSLGISGMLASIGGALLMPVTMAYPTVGFYNALLISFIIVIIGGLGSIIGTVVAGLSLGILQSLVTMFFMTEYAQFFSFILLLLFLVFKPEGLMGKKK